MLAKHLNNARFPGFKATVPVCFGLSSALGGRCLCAARNCQLSLYWLKNSGKDLFIFLNGLLISSVSNNRRLLRSCVLLLPKRIHFCWKQQICELGIIFILTWSFMHEVNMGLLVSEHLVTKQFILVIGLISTNQFPWTVFQWTDKKQLHCFTFLLAQCDVFHALICSNKYIGACIFFC